MNNLKSKLTLKVLLIAGLTMGCTGIIKSNTDISCTLNDIHDIVIDVKEKAKTFFSSARINKTFDEHINDLDPILAKVDILLDKYLDKFSRSDSDKEKLIYDILTQASNKINDVYNILISGYSTAFTLGMALEGAFGPAEINKLEDMAQQLRPYLEGEKEEIDALEDLIDTIESFEVEQIVPASSFVQLRILKNRMRGQ